MDVISQYRALHEQGHFRGYSVEKHANAIGDLIDETGARSLLDYGCGKGEQYSRSMIHYEWAIMPYLYDPAVPGLDIKPLQKFDGVICSDVAEHIPEEDVDAFLSEVIGYAEKFVFLSICCRAAKKSLPDGRNCHLTVRDESWWVNKVHDHHPGHLRVVIHWNP